MDIMKFHMEDSVREYLEANPPEREALQAEVDRTVAAQEDPMDECGEEYSTLFFTDRPGHRVWFNLD